MPTERAKSKLTAVARASAIDENQESCPVCFGSGMEIVAGKGARVCSCQRNNNDSSTLDKAKLPRRYAGCHFNSYSPSDPSQVKALRLATQFTMEYPAVERGLIFTGPVGVGKTHLAVSILKGLTERGFRCLFYEFGSLLKEIRIHITRIPRRPS
jgi:DNA replication protein DnaC